MRKVSYLVVLGMAIFVVPVARLTPAQENSDLGKVVGTWKVEVYSGNATYYVDLVVTDSQGQLAGKVSESTGTFTDVPISEIFYDSVSFRFQFVAPTPPDGVSRTVYADFKVAEDTMGGTISIPDLNFAGDAKATRVN